MTWAIHGPCVLSSCGYLYAGHSTAVSGAMSPQLPRQWTRHWGHAQAAVTIVFFHEVAEEQRSAFNV